jgi:hypothetical protein
MAEQIKRQVAFKLRISDLLRGKPILEDAGDLQRFKFLDLGNRQVIRVNVVANIIEKYLSDGSSFSKQSDAAADPPRKKYLSFTIDDASGQVRIKTWGEEVERFSNLVQGNTVLVTGTLRFFNNELYISPEIIRIIDPRYLLVRKLELDKEKPKVVDKEEIKAIKDQIIDMIKQAEAEGGIDTERIVLELKAAPELINQEIQKILEEGLAYEPRPGKIRYLG